LGSAGKELIVSTGAVSGEVAKALKILGLDTNQESNFGFLHVHRIKPLNQEVINHVRAASKVIVFDEHLAFGGLSSALLDGTAEAAGNLPPIHSVNLGISFPEQQSYDRGLDLSGLSSDAISTVLAGFLR
jgi:transketolase C-terminal domain/subunit